VEAAGVEPASEAPSRIRDTWPSGLTCRQVSPRFRGRQSSLYVFDPPAVARPRDHCRPELHPRRLGHLPRGCQGRWMAPGLQL